MKFFQYLVILLFLLGFSTDKALAISSSEAERIIQDYGQVLEQVAEILVASQARLPYPKEKIKEAILHALPLSSGRMKEILRAGYVQLGMFQDVKELPFLSLPKMTEPMSRAELEAWAIKIINTDKGIKLQKYVNSEMRMLMEELKAKGF